MLIPLSEILNFPTFYNQIKKERISISVAYKLSKLKKEVDFHLNFYRENLQKIISEYAQKEPDGTIKTTPDGQNVLLIPEFSAECSKKIKELCDLKIELTDPQLTLADFDNLTLELEALEPLFPFLN